MSRLSQARHAVRPALKGRLLLSGPSGSGKTWTGLTIATELAPGEPVLGIDTEKESMLTFADDFTFTHLHWDPPYDPRELAKTLDEAGRDYGVILIDSLTHFWRSEGGTLDIANGKFTGWKDARPAQEELVEAILRCDTHVVLTARSKVEHTQELENGKHVVRKLGMATQQDDNLEYEMNVAVELSMDHTASISKSRTTVLPVGRAFRPGHAKDLANDYRTWLASGEPLAPLDVVADLKGRCAALPEPMVRKLMDLRKAKGLPVISELHESQVEDFTLIVKELEAKADDMPVNPDEPPCDSDPVEASEGALR